MPVITPLGRQANFQCRVVSNPPANVSWAFGTLQETLSNGGRIFFNSSVLIISNAQPSDEGQYYCIAENSYGINSTSAPFSIGGDNIIQTTVWYNGRTLDSRLEGYTFMLYCKCCAFRPLQHRLTTPKKSVEYHKSCGKDLKIRGGALGEKKIMKKDSDHDVT